MKSYTLDQVQDKLIGEKGTSERDKFECELVIDLIGKAIRQTQQEHHLAKEKSGNKMKYLYV